MSLSLAGRVWSSQPALSVKRPQLLGGSLERRNFSSRSVGTCDCPEDTEAQRLRARGFPDASLILAQVQVHAQRVPPEGHLGAEAGVLRGRGEGPVLLTRQVPSPLSPALTALTLVPHHDHAGQLDLRLVGWDQGDGDTGRDRDGGARRLDGAVRWCQDAQLQLQRGVQHCRGLRAEQGGRVNPGSVPR